MKLTRWIAVLALVLLALMQTAEAAQPKQLTAAEIRQRLREGKPAFTEAQAQAYVREMLPLVEQAAGRKFKTAPKIKLVRRSDLVPVLAAELVPQIKRMYPELTTAQANSAAYVASSSYSISLLGKYGTATQKLYLLPRNFQPLMDFAEVAPKYRQEIIKLVIAHEMAHALHDQYVSMTKLEEKINTVEKSLAFAATIEGFAMFVEDRIADELKIDAAAKELASVIATGSLKGLDPFTELVSKQRAGMVSDQYLRGRDFITWQFQKGGIDQVWQVLASPPLATSVIYHPETYSAAPTPDIDYAHVLDGLEKLLDSRKWKVNNSILGEMEIRNGYASMDDKDKEAIFPNIERAQRLDATSGDCAMRLALVVMKDRSGPPALISAAERLGKANFEKLKASKSYKLTPFAPADFNEMKGKADIARRLVFSVSAGGETRPFSFFRVARGRVMAELYAEGLSIPGSKAAAMFEELFKRLPIKD